MSLVTSLEQSITSYLDVTCSAPRHSPNTILADSSLWPGLSLPLVKRPADIEATSAEALGHLSGRGIPLELARDVLRP